MFILQLKNNLTKSDIRPPISKVMVKFLWSFGFLSWFSTYFFITSCGLNGYVYMLEIVLDILDKFIHDYRNISGCLTMNEMHIKLTSLIICSIKDNLTNTWSTRPAEGKNILYIANLIILYALTETSIYWKFKDKICKLF